MDDHLSQYLEKRRDHTFFIPIGLNGSGKSSILTTIWGAIDESLEYEFDFNSGDDSADSLRDTYLEDFKLLERLPSETESLNFLNGFWATDGFMYNSRGNFWKLSYFDFSGKDFKALKKLVGKNEPENEKIESSSKGRLSVKPLKEASQGSMNRSKVPLTPKSRILFGNLVDDLFSQLKSPFYLFLVADVTQDADLQDRFFSRFLEFILECESSDLKGVLLFLNKWDLRDSEEDFNEFVKNSYGRTFSEFLSLNKLGVTVKIFPFSIGRVSEDDPRVLAEPDDAYARDFLLFFEQQILSKIKSGS